MADVWERYGARGDGDRTALSAAERAVFAVCDLRQDVNSGGFDSYFRYSGGNTAPQALDVLAEVLGQDWADLLVDAMRPFGSPYRLEPDDRADVIDRTGLDETFDDLDSRFFVLEAEADADTRLNEYLEAADG